MRLAQLSLWLLITVALMCVPALAEPAASGFQTEWDDFAITPTLDAFTRPSAPVAVPAAQKPEPKRNLDFQLDGNKVDFGTIRGAAGARITPKESPVTVGVAVKPPHTDLSQSIPLNYGAYSNGFDGAFEFKLRDGPITPSMTVTGPVTDGASGGNRTETGEYRTMFGLGYSF